MQWSAAAEVLVKQDIAHVVGKVLLLHSSVASEDIVKQSTGCIMGAFAADHDCGN